MNSLFILAEQRIALANIRQLGIAWTEPEKGMELVNDTIISLDDKILVAFNDLYAKLPDNDERKGCYFKRYIKSHSIFCLLATGADGQPFVYCREYKGKAIKSIKELVNWLRDNRVEGDSNE